MNAHWIPARVRKVVGRSSGPVGRTSPKLLIVLPSGETWSAGKGVATAFAQQKRSIGTPRNAPQNAVAVAGVAGEVTGLDFSFFDRTRVNAS